MHLARFASAILSLRSCASGSNLRIHHAHPRPSPFARWAGRLRPLFNCGCFPPIMGCRSNSPLTPTANWANVATWRNVRDRTSYTGRRCRNAGQRQRKPINREPVAYVMTMGRHFGIIGRRRLPFPIHTSRLHTNDPSRHSSGTDFGFCNHLGDGRLGGRAPLTAPSAIGLRKRKPRCSVGRPVAHSRESQPLRSFSPSPPGRRQRIGMAIRSAASTMRALRCVSLRRSAAATRAVRTNSSSSKGQSRT